MFQLFISISLLASKEFLTCQLEKLVCRSFLTQVSGCLNKQPLVSKFLPSGPHHEHQGQHSSLSLENRWMLLFTFLASRPVPCQFLERGVELRLSTLASAFLRQKGWDFPVGSWSQWGGGWPKLRDHFLPHHGVTQGSCHPSPHTH